MLENIFNFMKKDNNDGVVETGNVNSLTFEQVVKRYLSKPNDLLKILRIYRKIEISQLAQNSQFNAMQIEAFEEGTEEVPHQFLCEIMRLYNVNLKLLLCCFGFAKWEDIANNEEELPLAAQYSGEELSKDEKVDLGKLFQLIIENRKKKK